MLTGKHSQKKKKKKKTSKHFQKKVSICKKEWGVVEMIFLNITHSTNFQDAIQHSHERCSARLGQVEYLPVYLAVLPEPQLPQL